MSFPKYPAYKDSGVEWIGEIPVGWNVAPLFSISTENRDKNTGLKSSNTLSLSYGNIIARDKNDNFGLLPDSYETYQIVKFGDIIFRLTDLQNDKNSLRSAISRYDGIITSAYLSIKTEKDCSPFYVSYLMRAYDCEKVFYSMGGGVRQSLNFKEFKHLSVIIPPLTEQQTIASFLDRECGKIDALIAEQERLIALLAEKRQGVISHAVTKGLNPNVPMKDSGIPWIGMVPEGWDYSRLRFVAQFNPSKTEISYLPLNEEISFLPMEAIGDDGTINLEQKRKISDVQNGYTYFRDMDIVFAKITPCFENGKGAVVKGLLRGVGFGTTELIVARSVPSRVIPEYLFLFFQSDIFRKPAEASMYGAGGQKRVSERFVRDFSISLPPLPEQQAIASFLDLECRKIDTLIAEQKAMLALCKERRAALISAAVTGKIDVRAQSKARAA
ncbi:MAG: restriction endonuclease subunit S [Komagataeibacter hansenii]|nr:restriction endonuclease subunit S [Novacetimonas hansenii]